MRTQIKKWLLRITVTGAFLIALLIGIILNPVLTYANKTVHNNYTIFYNQTVDSALLQRLDAATQLIASSEFYDPKVKLHICLNDGSAYPALIQTLQGRAFAWGFYNKVVLAGAANAKENFVLLNGYKWNLTQLLAHEITHCYQYNKRGFWGSNPVAKIATWKWEGYPEYVARQNNEQQELQKNIARLFETEKENTNGWIQFSDSTGTVIPYYKNWLLVQYCMDIKKMTYVQLLDDTTNEETVQQQMLNCYRKQEYK